MSVEDLAEPVLGIAKGDPDDQELAAVAVALAIATRSAPPPRESDDRPLAGGWKSYWRTVRRPMATGREAWRSTYR